MLKAALPGEIIRKEGRGDVAMIMSGKQQYPTEIQEETVRIVPEKKYQRDITICKL